jgi:hypothetical protein
VSTELHYIQRFCFNDSNPHHRKVVRRGLSLAQAQEHCQHPATSSDDGSWFDGYQRGDVDHVEAPTATPNVMPTLYSDGPE